MGRTDIPRLRRGFGRLKDGARENGDCGCVYGWTSMGRCWFDYKLTSCFCFLFFSHFSPLLLPLSFF